MVVLAAVGLTIYVGGDAYNIMIYNFVFLGIMAVLFLAGMFGGMFRLIDLAGAFRRATQQLTDRFAKAGKAEEKELQELEGIFSNTYLDGKMNVFLETVQSSHEGIAEVEEFINEDEVDIHVHKRLLEMVPDILTSLGILGTFVGLVWGLKNFEPSNYEAMTTSVASLVEGIKVAFLTSIYGISLSIVYSYGMRSAYSAMGEQLQGFLDKFHANVIPTAENESRNLLVSSTRQQVEAMDAMSEKVAKEMADRFAATVTPVFNKMNQSMDALVNSMDTYQEEALKTIVQAFLREMNKSFRTQFSDFNEALEELKTVQTKQTEYTASLYRNLSKDLSENYQKQEKLMKNSVRDLLGSMDTFSRTAENLTADSLEIQKQQRVDYEHVLSYMKEAEKTSAEFWVACNQAMQKYVEIAAASTEKVGNAGKVSAAVIRENRGLLQTLDGRIAQYAQQEQEATRTMKELNRLLTELSADRSGNEIHMTNSARSGREIERLQKTIEEQGERQEELLGELITSVKELTKASKKGSKLPLFK
jgi:hypothetical protein